MTIFAKIIAGDIPCDKIYEDEHILAFHDIYPDAKVHALVIPKKEHLARIQDATPEDAQLLGHLMAKIPEIAEKIGIAQDGYRVVTNCGDNSGQEVPHLHFHILGGERLAPLNAK